MCWRLIWSTYHIDDFEVSEREGDGVGRCGHGQHEGQRRGDGAGQHHVQRVDPDSLGLGDVNTTQLNTARSRVCYLNATRRRVEFCSPWSPVWAGTGWWWLCCWSTRWTSPPACWAEWRWRRGGFSLEGPTSLPTTRTDPTPGDRSYKQRCSGLITTRPVFPELSEISYIIMNLYERIRKGNSVFTSLPLARAKPPPSSRMMFQGIRSWTTCQFSSGLGYFTFLPVSPGMKREHGAVISFKEQRHIHWVIITQRSDEMKFRSQEHH